MDTIKAFWNSHLSNYKFTRLDVLETMLYLNLFTDSFLLVLILHLMNLFTLLLTSLCLMANMRGLTIDLRMSMKLPLAWRTNMARGSISRCERRHPAGQMTRWITEAGIQQNKQDNRIRKVIPAARRFCR